MRITIFGASGKVGRHVVELALAQGHTVVAVVHKHNIFTGSPNLIVQTANVYDAAEVAQAIEGSEAVISCLASWGRHTPDGNRNVLTASMRNIIPAMQQQGIKRIVTLTGSGAAEPTQPPSAGSRLFLKLLQPFPAGKVFKDGEVHMQLLHESDLAWTTIRSPFMTGQGEATYHLSVKPAKASVRVSRQAVAAALVDEVAAIDFVRQAPIIFQA